MVCTYVYVCVCECVSVCRGSQRYGGGVWSGDTKSTWEDFNQQFRAGLNMVLSGITYWTTGG